MTQATQQAPALTSVTHPADLWVVTTAEATELLNRQAQTLRKWAPICTRRVHGRLWWAPADIEGLIAREGVQ